jgi:dihydroorotate dehydrogenase (NAD+) catalytic subunit
VSPDVRRIDPATLIDTDERAIPPGEVDLAVDLGGIAMANPITTASGCFASGAEIDRFYDITDLGAIVVKSITLEPREGLPTPRMAETPSGMLNAIGLQNPGIDAWLERDLPWLQARGAKVIASIAGTTVDDFREVARKLKRHGATAKGAGDGGVVGLEVNLSCPNVEHRGLVFACSPIDSAEVIRAVVREADVPVFGKLTSDVTDIVEIAGAVLEAGADGLTLINTLLGMAIDPETGKPELSNTYGGLSGPAIRPIAVRNVHQVHQAFPDVPIIGCGGIRRVTDVIEFVRAGATAVAVGTATFIDPFAAKLLVDELRAWLAQRGIRSVTELRGEVHPW